MTVPLYMPSPPHIPSKAEAASVAVAEKKNQSSWKLFLSFCQACLTCPRDTIIWTVSMLWITMQIFYFYCRSPDLSGLQKKKQLPPHCILHLPCRCHHHHHLQKLLYNCTMLWTTKKGNISFFWWRSLLRWQCVGEVIIPPMVRCSRIITPFLCSLAWRYYYWLLSQEE